MGARVWGWGSGLTNQDVGIRSPLCLRAISMAPAGPRPWSEPWRPALGLEVQHVGCILHEDVERGLGKWQGVARQPAAQPWSCIRVRCGCYVQWLFSCRNKAKPGRVCRSGHHFESVVESNAESLMVMQLYAH